MSSNELYSLNYLIVVYFIDGVPDGIGVDRKVKSFICGHTATVTAEE